MTLLALQANGGLWCALLFTAAFLAVHAAKLAIFGYRMRKQPPPKEEKAPEPVYFLVERKKKRPKKEFSEPKEINFR